MEAAGAGLAMEPESADDLVTVLLKLESNPALAQQLGKSGREHVLKHYNRNVLAEYYLQLLTQLAESF